MVTYKKETAQVFFFFFFIEMNSRVPKKVLRPSQQYLDNVKETSVTLKEPKNQLLILDLNGTLVSRAPRNTTMYVRPYSNLFFDYIFQNFTVMVWSSAQPHSVDFMCRMFGSYKSKISAIWDRTSFGLNSHQFRNKVTTIKDLEKVWQHFGSEVFNATNTILLDDSPNKTVLQPFNVIHPIEFEHHSTAFSSNGDSELIQILDYLKIIRYQSNVANYIKSHPYESILNNEHNSYKTIRFIMANGNESHLVDFSLNNLSNKINKF